MEKRRKITMKTMEDMSVLDMTAGAMEQETEGSGKFFSIFFFFNILIFQIFNV
jgi:hypothetical protein